MTTPTTKAYVILQSDDDHEMVNEPHGLVFATRDDVADAKLREHVEAWVEALQSEPDMVGEELPIVPLGDGSELRVGGFWTFEVREIPVLS